MTTRDLRHSRRFGLPGICLLLTGILAAAGMVAGLTPVTAGNTRAVASPAVSAAPPVSRQPPGRRSWVSIWAAAPQAPPPGAPTLAALSDQTIRNIVYTSLGGAWVRVRLTNVFGTRPLRIGGASLAASSHGGAGERRAQRVMLSFRGRSSTVVAPGADVLSDPIRFSVRPLEDLAVSIFVLHGRGAATMHPQAQQYTYLASGDRVLDPDASGFRRRTTSWYLVDDISALEPGRRPHAVVALGDSITDGVGSVVGANARWPSDLARRLLVAGAPVSVVDEGIGGNRLLSDTPCCGQSAVMRFDRDVLQRAGARIVILLEGINDIGEVKARGADTAPHADVAASQMIAGDRRIIAAAHAAGLTILGATLTPFAGSRHWTPAGEVTRLAVNRWIRTSGAFDGVIDFAHVVADPSDPHMINPAYDSGDHLHPNDRGYQAMAESIPLAWLERRPATAKTHAPTRRGSQTARRRASMPTISRPSS